MPKNVRLTAIQPPAPDKIIRNADMLEAAYKLTDQAGQLKSDIVLLPELINLYEVTKIDYMEMAAPKIVTPLIERYSALAKKHNMYIILCVGEAREDSLHNYAIILGRNGKEVGRYEKTHISQPEHLLYPKIKAGNSLPVFDLDFGRIAVITCYDLSFPEISIIYALKGADFIFYPRWQSGPSEIFFEIQMRARALDHATFLVSSSFGAREGIPWKPGMLFGRSCVIGRDGTILSDAGHEVGIASTIVDAERPRLIECLEEVHGEGLIKKYRELIHEDRRPELYKLISGLTEK
jgi:omega-amidase